MKATRNALPTVLFGLLIFALSLWGALYAVRAARAQQLYHAGKYGAQENATPDSLAAGWNRSYALYPHNYHLCIAAAEKCWYSRYVEPNTEDPSRLADASLWCDRGLEANFYPSQLRLLKTHLLEKESLPDAAEYWEEYVDWHFWAPYNHAVLVDLYARVGDYTMASDSLERVKGSGHYKEAQEKLREAWQKEMAIPPD